MKRKLIIGNSVGFLIDSSLYRSVDDLLEGSVSNKIYWLVWERLKRSQVASITKPIRDSVNNKTL